MLPGREVRALSAVCRSVSPSCHGAWGSSHSFPAPTCCSARRTSESARQRCTEDRSLSTSAKQERDCQQLPPSETVEQDLYKLCKHQREKMQIRRKKRWWFSSNSDAFIKSVYKNVFPVLFLINDLSKENRLFLYCEYSGLPHKSKI